LGHSEDARNGRQGKPSIFALIYGSPILRREEARCLFRENPYFATWDPEALEVYLECALTTDPNGGVRLKMLGVEEALIYTDLRTTYEVFHLLEKLHARIELRWILPENDAGCMVFSLTSNRINDLLSSCRTG
jgi:hypothetical protein